MYAGQAIGYFIAMYQEWADEEKELSMIFSHFFLFFEENIVCYCKVPQG